MSKDPQVLGNRWSGYRKDPGNLASGTSSSTQQIEHGAARGIG
jgi:hypothetical protein